MSATYHNIATDEIYPQPDFRASRDNTGLWTGFRSYKIRLNSWLLPDVRNNFAQGTTVTTIDSTLGDYWEFLKIHEVDVEDEPGGIKSVMVSMRGYSESDDLATDREVQYEMRGVLTEQDVRKHPQYLVDVFTSSDRRAISGIIDASAFVSTSETDDDGVMIRGIQKQEVISEITDNATRTWAELVIEGLRDYLAPSVEWTKTTTNLSGVSQDTFDNLGKIDAPDGSPPTPSGNGTYNWLLIGVNESKGEDEITTSVTWQMSDTTGWSELLYDY